MLPHTIFLATGLVAATLADILVVPAAHVRYSVVNVYDLGSIIPDNDIIGMLDFQENPTYRGGVSLDCSKCPYVAKFSNRQGYVFRSAIEGNSISVSFDTGNKQLNLNENPFLDSQMKDLHRPQSTTQDGSYLDYPNIYNGSLPTTYDVRVVQVRTVQLQDGSLIEFYSIDVTLLSLGDQPINVQKVNVHVIKLTDGTLELLPFTYTFPKDPPLAAVSVSDFPSQSGSELSNTTMTTATSVAISSKPPSVTSPSATSPSAASPSATSPSLGPSSNSTVGGSPSVVSPSAPTPSTFTGAASSPGVSIFFAATVFGFLATYLADL